MHAHTQTHDATKCVRAREERPRACGPQALCTTFIQPGSGGEKLRNVVRNEEQTVLGWGQDQG